MRTLTSILTLAILFTAVGEIQGQATPDFEDELRSMAAATTPVERDRQVVLDFLDRPDVGVAAATHGIDLQRLPGAVGSMDAVAVADLARHVRDLADDRDQVGGNTIVISSTAVIIVLLILILINQ